jgi:uncharacterized protein CbrC (UPF0167 family)
MNNSPAFPQYKYHPDPFSHGMTLRDYFAAKVMQGICASDPVSAMTNERIAAESYDLADAMLKAREL